MPCKFFLIAKISGLFYVFLAKSLQADQERNLHLKWENKRKSLLEGEEIENYLWKALSEQYMQLLFSLSGNRGYCNVT